MRSEGFPFIVGVWGWTCVRVVFVVWSLAGPRRLLVGSLISLLWAVHTHTMRQNHFLQSMKGKWRKSRTKCSFWRFEVARWEVILAFCVTGTILWSVSMQARRFLVAGAALCNAMRRTLQCGRRSIWCRVRSAFSMNSSVRAAQT